MKKLLLVLFLIAAITGVNAQTATNFTCNDCNGTSHDLFTELDAGKVVVICWVMPCNSCISGALTCSNVTQSFTSNVSYYLCDDLANTNCTSLNSWATANNVTGATLFSNAAIKMSDYNGSGMPKCVVIGGPNHTVFYNANNTFNATTMQGAINQALTTTGIKEQNLNISSMSIYPSPVKDASTLKFNASKSSEIMVGLFNLEGKKLQDVYTGVSNTGENTIALNLEAYPNGMYLVKLTEGDKSQYMNVVVLH